MKCLYCNNKLNETDKFCTVCGKNVKEQKRELEAEIINEALEKVNTCKIVWFIVGLIQILISSLFLYSIILAIPLISMGFVAIVHSHGLSEAYKGFCKQPRTMVSHFGQGKAGLVLSIVANLILGGVIGVIPAIYELSLSRYILAKKNALEGRL